MIIYRVPPFPLVLTLEDLPENTQFNWSLVDEYSGTVFSGADSTDSGGTLLIPIPHEHDDDYVLKLSLGDNLYHLEQVSVVRPYIDVKKLLPPEYTQEQFNDAVESEVVARGIIDGFTSGFYVTKERYETEGTGSDYLIVPNKLNRLFKVWESGVLVYDSEAEHNTYDFGISADRTSIIHIGDDDYEHGRAISLRPMSSDHSGGFYSTRAFPEGKDYVIEFETGNEVVPPAVTQAAKLLIQDISSNAHHTNRFILEYATDQYKIKYSARALMSTGNRTVDQLLKPYRGYDVRAGTI